MLKARLAGATVEGRPPQPAKAIGASILSPLDHVGEQPIRPRDSSVTDSVSAASRQTATVKKRPHIWIRYGVNIESQNPGLKLCGDTVGKRPQSCCFNKR